MKFKKKAVAMSEIAHFQRQIELHPDDGAAYLHLAHALQRSGDHQAAASCLEQAIARIPGLAEAHYKLGNICVPRGQIGRPATHLRQAAKLRPDFAEAHNNLANALLTLTQPDEAIEHLKMAI